ncbi:MAG: sigma-70 family RNA polymerase sigma factor [bacterium]|nr:sigma-70 family RNA polymerase sigma factor [bacterium]
MKITAISRYKNGLLLDAIREANWSQVELARRSGVSVMAVGHAINLKRTPREEIITKMQFALGEVGVFLDVEKAFPKSFKGFKKAIVVEQSQDIDPLQLVDIPIKELMDSNSCIEQVDRGEIGLLLSNALETLTERERKVLEWRWMDELTYEEIGKRLKFCTERIRQIESKSLRKLRHPKRMKVLLDVSNSVEEEGTFEEFAVD